MCDSFNPKAEAGQNTFLDLCTIHGCTNNIGLIKGCVLHGGMQESEGTFQQMMMPEEQEEKNVYMCTVPFQREAPIQSTLVAMVAMNQSKSKEPNFRIFSLSDNI